MKTKQTSIAIINDVSGYGRCSITVALPILSAMKVSCGIVPTAILSNQTEYDRYTMLDFTPHMNEYIATWQQLHFSFDGLYTGFLGSSEQITIIKQMIHDFSFEQIIVDPVMGDHGILYDSYTKSMCQAMRELVRHATVITPNLTELCILTNQTYQPDFTDDAIRNMCEQLTKEEKKTIIVTGIERDDQIGNALYENGSYSIFFEDKICPLRPGTGDVFASIISGCVLSHIPMKEAIPIAANFIKQCLITSKAMDIPINAGVCFEEHLNQLTALN